MNHTRCTERAERRVREACADMVRKAFPHTHGAARRNLDALADRMEATNAKPTPQNEADRQSQMSIAEWNEAAKLVETAAEVVRLCRLKSEMLPDDLYEAVRPIGHDELRAFANRMKREET